MEPPRTAAESIGHPSCVLSVNNSATIKTAKPRAHDAGAEPTVNSSCCRTIPTARPAATEHSHHQWLRGTATTASLNPFNAKKTFSGHSAIIKTSPSTGYQPLQHHSIDAHHDRQPIESTASPMRTPFTSTDPPASQSSSAAASVSASAVTGSTTTTSSAAPSSSSSSSPASSSSITVVLNASAPSAADRRTPIYSAAPPVNTAPPSEADHHHKSARSVHKSSSSEEHVVTIQISSSTPAPVHKPLVNPISAQPWSDARKTFSSVAPSVSSRSKKTSQTNLNEGTILISDRGSGGQPVSVVCIAEQPVPADAVRSGPTTSSHSSPSSGSTQSLLYIEPSQPRIQSDSDTDLPDLPSPTGSSGLVQRFDRSSTDDDMVVQKASPNSGANNNSGHTNNAKSTFMYYMMTSGQCSPTSDTMDSGTCSDLESTPPPLPKKYNTKSNGSHLHGTINNGAKSSPSESLHSFTDDSEESESSLSFDSLNTGAASAAIPIPPPMQPFEDIHRMTATLPDSLLRDIRDRTLKYEVEEEEEDEDEADDEVDAFDLAPKRDLCQQHLRPSQTRGNRVDIFATQHMGDGYSEGCYENDKFYTFHINERLDNGVGRTADGQPASLVSLPAEDESFAGYKELKGLGQHTGTSTIRSSKGTVRGVKNRVRNGIATFLQMQQANVKSYKEKDAGKVVLYTTSMGIVRQTYAKCANVKQILRTLLVKFEERDVFMSIECQQEIRERMQSDDILIPQLYVDGHHVGDADQVERLNESGELRQMLKPYKSTSTTFTCQTCGGFRLLPCPSCKGSKKSVHRNHFTTEFVALKCMNCDEVGLVKCYSC